MYIVQTEKGHCWAHISSRDLLHWRQHPLALEPGGVDSGIFSGGAFIDKSGVPTITYWGLGPEAGICAATSTDDALEVWTKASSPIVHQTESGLAVLPDGTPVGAADPSAIWVQDGRYYMLTGNLLVQIEYGRKRGQAEHLGDTLYLFRSDDLVHWEYLHPFYQSRRDWTRADEDDMCPDFFPLGDRHMLLFISHNLGCQYYLGSYADDHFYPETHGRMSWVDRAFFAPESLVDERGRRIMWAWIFEGYPRAEQEANLWAGTMSLPRVLWLGEDKTLRMAPPEELATLRYNPRAGENLTLRPGADVRLDNVSGRDLELCVEMAGAGAAQYGVAICCSPDGAERTLVYYDADKKHLAVDTTRTSLWRDQRTEQEIIDAVQALPQSIEAGPLELAPGEPLRLRVFVDRSVVEVFANDRQAVMRRIYPTRADSVGVELFASGGAAQVTSWQAWEMDATNAW
jgi:beta-fructofuranosidase